MFNKSVFVCIAALLFSASALADEEYYVKPPVIPERLESGDSIEPDVNIIQKDDKIIEEYRLNGHLYMIKITPSKGYPYYLMDTDGDGSFETTQHELNGMLVPQWILFRW